MNIIYNNDANNFIHDIVESRSPQDTTNSLRTSLKSVSASASNIKFGKLTLNRAPSKEKVEQKASLPSEINKAPNNRNISPGDLNKMSKSK